MEISNRRSLANTYFIQNDIRKAFSTLISIKQSVIQSFDVGERDKLKEVEKKYNSISIALYGSVASSFNSKINEAYKMARKLTVKLYSEYNNMIMDLLEKYGYLIGEQSDASMMKF